MVLRAHPQCEGPYMYIGRSTDGICIGIAGMGCYESLSPVSGNEFLSHWNESLCVEMSRYEITRVVGHPPKTFARTRLPCVCWIPRCPWSSCYAWSRLTLATRARAWRGRCRACLATPRTDTDASPPPRGSARAIEAVELVHIAIVQPPIHTTIRRAKSEISAEMTQTGQKSGKFHNKTQTAKSRLIENGMEMKRR